MTPERRRYERRPLRQETYCYIDGVRLDGVALDASPGGMFVTIPDPAEVEVASPVALVFKAMHGLSEPVFLFGRVVRGQMTPVPGIGVAWVRAVGSGPASEMAALLHDVFGVEDPDLVRVTTSDGRTRNVYAFANAPPSDAFLDRAASTRRMRPVNPGSQGVVSRQIARAYAGAPAAIEAVLTVDGQSFRGVIRRLGVSGMSVETRRSLKRADQNVFVRFEIPAADGVAVVSCTCRLLGASAASWEGATPMVLLEILDLDEGGRHGIVERYVKWLHLRGMT